MSKSLVIGIGNNGREDDGLGWAFLDNLPKKYASKIDIEYRYQLQVEDAELISKYTHVLFVDADKRLFPKGFQIAKTTAKDSSSYTSHELQPESILNLCQMIYKKNPLCYNLGISGSSFNLKIGLTATGTQNLQNALAHLEVMFGYLSIEK
jgi:hydrogenase maturation protease